MSTYGIPIDYKSGVPAGNAMASGGFSESFVIKRFVPNNGTDFRQGSRVNFNIKDSECILHPNQMYLKWKPVAQKGGAIYTGTLAQGAISGQTSAIKNVTLSYSGKNIETIMNYNRFCAQEYINAPLEHKIFLEKTEGLTFFSNGTMSKDNRRSFLGDNNGERYAMHQLQIGLRGMSSLELPLLPTGLDLELGLTSNVTDTYPVSDNIDNQLWQNVELVCVFTRPVDGFWSKFTSKLERGETFQRPIQTVRYQSYQPTNSSSFTMTVDCGVARSISSILVCGSDIPSGDDALKYDKLSYSTDMGIRTISFSVGGKRIPEGKAISYSKNDPELYVMGFRGRDFENMAFVPSTYLFDNAGKTGDTPGTDGAVNVRGWQFRFSLKDVLSGYADGLQSLSGSFQINVSTIPESPDYLNTTPPALGAEKSLDVWYVTDQILEISVNGLRVTPVW